MSAVASANVGVLPELFSWAPRRTLAASITRASERYRETTLGLTVTVVWCVTVVVVWRVTVVVVLTVVEVVLFEAVLWAGLEPKDAYSVAGRARRGAVPVSPSLTRRDREVAPPRSLLASRRLGRGDRAKSSAWGTGACSGSASA